VSEWVSVKERLPVANQRVFVACDNDVVVVAEISHGIFVGSTRWIFEANHHSRHYEPEVTHWMPLPEPPKEGA
jgi:hypothetical protein